MGQLAWLSTAQIGDESAVPVKRLPAQPNWVEEGGAEWPTRRKWDSKSVG